MSFLGNRPDSFQYGSTAYDHFSGDGVTTTFTLSRQVSANGDIQVVVNNVIQDPGVAYGVSNLNTLTFTGAPTAGTNNIYVVYRQFVQSGIAPGANTVTMSAIAANTIQPWQLSNSLLNPLVSTFTGDGSTVTFTLTQAAVSSNSCSVTVNGITQGAPANYSINGSTLTFTSAPAANSNIRVVQNSVVGTSIVPVDGSVTNSKLASNLTLTGNTYLSTISTVGTNTNLIIDPNGTGDVVFTPATELIIQSGAPSTNTTSGALQVLGGIGLSGNVFSGSTITANNGLYSSNNFTGTYTDGIVMDYVTGNGRISVGGGDGLTFYNGGPATTALMTLTSGGSLGIGTTNPSFLLDVQGSSGDVVIRAKANATGNAGLFRADGGGSTSYPGFQIAQSGTTLWSLDSRADTNLYFNRESGSGNVLIPGGNLGIGVTPTSTLQVQGTSGSTQFQAGSSNNGMFINAYDGASIYNLAYGTNSTAVVFGAQTNIPVYFYVNNSAVANFGTSGNLTFNKSNAGIIFNNSSASTNSTLNDYETGTWTPGLQGFSGTTGWTFNNAVYVKIGKIVYIAAQISGGSGNLVSTSNVSYINGLPFNVSGPNSPCNFATNYIEDLGTGSIYGTTGIYSPTFSVANSRTIQFSGVYTAAF